MHKLFTLICLIISSLYLKDGNPATFDTQTGILTVKALRNGDNYFTDAQLRLNADGTYEFIGGTLTNLPLECNKFSNEDSTQNELSSLIQNATSIDEINNAIGCHWLTRIEGVSSALGDASKSTDYVWMDDTCSLIGVNFTEINSDIFGNQRQVLVQFEQRDSSVTGCTNVGKVMSFSGAFESKLLLDSVLVDNSTLATDVILHLIPPNKFSLLNFKLSDNGTPPIICEPFSKTKFDKISSNMNGYNGPQNLDS